VKICQKLSYKKKTQFLKKLLDIFFYISLLLESLGALSNEIIFIIFLEKILGISTTLLLTVWFLTYLVMFLRSFNKAKVPFMWKVLRLRTQLTFAWNCLTKIIFLQNKKNHIFQKKSLQIPYSREPIERRLLKLNTRLEDRSQLLVMKSAVT